EGHITYHRTDSTNLSTQAIDMARSYIKDNFPQAALPDKPNFYQKKSKNAQEAHEAIRPTAPTPKISENGKLSATHAKLYDLIFRRFVASQMTPAVYEQTSVNVLGKGSSKDQELTARINGSVILQPGWM